MNVDVLNIFLCVIFWSKRQFMEIEWIFFSSEEIGLKIYSNVCVFFSLDILVGLHKGLIIWFFFRIMMNIIEQIKKILGLFLIKELKRFPQCF